MSEKHSQVGVFSELRRRNVFRVGIAYLLIAWVLLQIADVLFPALTLPEWTTRFVAAILILGFPLAIFFAWAYELTPDGLKRDSDANKAAPKTRSPGLSLGLAFVGIPVVAIVWFALDRYVLQPNTIQSNDPPTENAVTVANSIAVLPFVNMSSDEEQDYFSDGLSEELLNVLAGIKNLRVIGRTSSFQYKGKNEDLREIGEKLNVTHILEGSVRKSGDQVRITAQLIGSHDGVHIWSNTFDRTLDDIFEVQDSIARSVADALKIELLGGVGVQGTGLHNAEAYDLYLKGLRLRNMPGPENAGTALEYFKQAIELDPQLAPAWQQMASVYDFQTVIGAVPPEEGIRSMNEAIDRALELDPMMASGYYMLGRIRMNFEWDWDAADKAFSRALEIEPNHAEALSGASMLAAALGRTAESIELNKRSLIVDPLNLGSLHNRGFVHYLAGEFSLAESAFREALEFAGGSYQVGHTTLGLALIAQGKFDEALAEVQKELNEPFRLASESVIYYALGQEAESESAIQLFIEKYGDRAAVPIGGYFAFRGNADAAFEWYERAYGQHDAQLTWTKVHPMNENLISDPRFDALLEKLNLN